MTVRRELVFVYNADRGVWNKLFDAAHKVLSPTTYACSLCALSYGAVSMRAPWSSFIKSLPHRVRFAYRDEMRREGVPGLVPPVLLERVGGTWVTLLDKARLDGCKNLDELFAAVREVLR